MTFDREALTKVLTSSDFLGFAEYIDIYNFMPSTFITDY